MFVLQAPGEKLDWHQDWTTWMEQDDDISTSTWEIAPLGPVLSGFDIDIPADLTTVFVAGLVLGQSYQLKNTVETTGGRTGIREITIRCAPQ